jgi:DNA-binding XRE family transcriptional regulator
LQFRQRFGLSQRDAAKLLGISQVSWHLLESRKTYPRVPLAKRLEALTRIPAVKLLGLDVLPARRKRAS